MRKLIFIAFAVWSFWSNHGHAAEIRWVRTSSDTGAVTLKGVIRENDFIRLLDATIDADDHGVLISEIRVNSPGGIVSEGRAIAGWIQKQKLSVSVAADAECASACFMLFAAAAEKKVEAGAQVGVHSASVGGSVTPEADTATMSMVRYVTKLGVPSAITGRMVATQPYDMAWLSEGELRSMGATVVAAPATERPLAFRPLETPAAPVKIAPMPKPAYAVAAKPAPAKPKASED